MVAARQANEASLAALRTQLANELSSASERQRCTQRMLDSTTDSLAASAQRVGALERELSATVAALAQCREGMHMAAEDALSSCVRDFDAAKAHFVRAISFFPFFLVTRVGRRELKFDG